MKSFLIIGAGDFGHYLCRDLTKLKNEVLIVDKNEMALEDLLDVATGTLIADCRRESVLKRLGVSNFDVCFVCISSNFQSNLEITSLLKDLGAKYVVSQAGNEVHIKFLLRNGADEIIHPQKDSAMRTAVKYNSEHVFDYVDLKNGYSIYEITPLHEWENKSIIDSDIRAKYSVYIIGIVHSDARVDYMPLPQAVIRREDHLLILAHEDTMEKLLKRM